jgi:hypothetical protein
MCLFSHTCYMSRQTHTPWYDCAYSIWLGVLIMQHNFIWLSLNNLRALPVDLPYRLSNILYLWKMSRQDVRAREGIPFQNESVSVFHPVWLSNPIMFPRPQVSPPEVNIRICVYIYIYIYILNQIWIKGS